MSDIERDLCCRYEARIRGYGLRHLRDTTAAEDLVQHVLVAVLQAVRAGKVENVDAYVLGTCRYAVMDMKRGEMRQRRVAEHAVAELPVGYVPSTAGADRMRVLTCMQGLEPREFAIILGTFAYDRDADEIGRALELSPRERARDPAPRTREAASVRRRCRVTEHPISYDTLVALWTNDLAPELADPLEAHLFSCDECAAASERLGAIVGALRRLVPPVLSRTQLARLIDDGLHVDQLRVEPSTDTRAVFARTSRSSCSRCR